MPHSSTQAESDRHAPVLVARIGVDHARGVHQPQPHPPGRARRSGTAASGIREAIADFAAGKFVVIADDEGRENEGDLCVAAERVTPQHIAFMAREARGLICTAMAGDRIDELCLPPMAPKNTSRYGTAFTVSVEARDLTTTGISAHDRAATIRQLVNPSATAADFVTPGHTFPVRAAAGGVLERPGHTEAAVDLARAARLQPAGVICEIMNDDGTMARGADLAAFSARHGVRLITTEALVSYRRCTETLVTPIARCTLPMDGADWEACIYEDKFSGDHYLALIFGEVGATDPVLVRAHSECLTGDVFGSERCDCGAQLRLAMSRITDEGSGIVLYFCAHEGRGIGLANKVRAYELQESGLDTVEANLALHQPVDSRDYSAGSSILRDLGVRRIRLLTNNPAKLRGLDCHGVRVVERVALRPEPTEHNAAYLQTKRDKLGHLL